MAPSAYDTLTTNTQAVQSGSRVAPPAGARITRPRRTYHPTATRPGSSSTPMVESDSVRRGKTAKNANNNGPPATLVAKGSQNRRAGSAGTCSQNSASRIGSASEIVAIEARSSAPSSADGCDGRRRPTMMAKPSVTTCARRKANRPGGGRPGSVALARSTRRVTVLRAPCRRTSRPRGSARPRCTWTRCQSVRPSTVCPLARTMRSSVSSPARAAIESGATLRTTIAPLPKSALNPSAGTRFKSQVIRSAR